MQRKKSAIAALLVFVPLIFSASTKAQLTSPLRAIKANAVQSDR